MDDQTTIEAAPTWRGVLPLLIAALQDGTEEGRAIAKAELARMAQAADLYNDIERSKQS